MLNQPQVAGKRIWIESQRGPLPAAAAAVAAAARAGAANTVIGISGTGLRRLMRKEKALSLPILFRRLTYLSLSPSSSSHPP